MNLKKAKKYNIATIWTRALPRRVSCVSTYLKGFDPAWDGFEMICVEAKSAPEAHRKAARERIDRENERARERVREARSA